MINPVTIFIKLQHDDEFLFLCMRKVHEHQETDEQSTASTLHVNGVGFNRADAASISSYVGLLDMGVDLSEPQLIDAKDRMGKYCKQLSNILTEKDL